MDPILKIILFSFISLTSFDLMANIERDCKSSLLLKSNNLNKQSTKFKHTNFQQIYAEIPELDLNIENLAKKRNSQKYIWEHFGGPFEVVRVYRGIHLNSLDDFDPNYGLFIPNYISTDTPFLGAIDVTDDYELAKSFALSRTSDFKFALVIHYEVPAVLLSGGRSDAFAISSWNLSDLGIKNLILFQIQLELVNK